MRRAALAWYYIVNCKMQAFLQTMFLKREVHGYPFPPPSPQNPIELCSLRVCIVLNQYQTYLKISLSASLNEMKILACFYKTSDAVIYLNVDEIILYSQEIKKDHNTTFGGPFRSSVTSGNASFVGLRVHQGPVWTLKTD